MWPGDHNVLKDEGQSARVLSQPEADASVIRGVVRNKLEFRTPLLHSHVIVRPMAVSIILVRQVVNDHVHVGRAEVSHVVVKRNNVQSASSYLSQIRAGL